MKCLNKEKNMSKCNCTYTGCVRMGICCECLHYHREKNQLPACYFPADAEKIYNRSVDYFMSIKGE
ncbi:MAG: DUF6485 family protein [Candidatus Omnitrophica bacterium]|nr:DUF6485 family protein [Candidatus Omnitrophota bacterium]